MPLMAPVIVVGSLNMDMVSRVIRIPGAGETVVGLDFQLHTGGKGANQSVAVANLGHPVCMLGLVGDDIFGTQLRSALQAAGVRSEFIGKMDGPSGTASIAVDAQGENSIIVTPGANQQVTIQYVEDNKELLKSAGMVLAQLEIPLETIEYLAVMCRRFNVPLMLDPAPAQQLSRKTLEGLSWLTPNETEAEFYSPGAHTDAEVLQGLFSLGTTGVIVKKGAAGILLAEFAGQHVVVPSVPVVAVDTTAAGDCFNGAFAVGLLRGWSAEKSARFAVAAAAVSVTRSGAQPSLPTQREVDHLLSSVGTPIAKK